MGQEQTDFPDSAKFLVAGTQSTVPEVNNQAVPSMVNSESGGRVALHESELSLDMGWVVFQLHSDIFLVYPILFKFLIFKLHFLSSYYRFNVPIQPQFSHIGRKSNEEYQTVVISSFTICAKILVLQASAGTIGVVGLTFQAGNIDCKQEQHIVKYQKETGMLVDEMCLLQAMIPPLW